MDDTAKSREKLLAEVIQLRQIRSALEERAARYKSSLDEYRLQSRILEGLHEGIHMVRLSDRTIIYANHVLEEMLGYDEGELIGCPISIINEPNAEYQGYITEEISTALNSRGHWNGEVRNVRKDGTWIWCWASVSLFDHPQQDRVALSVLSDITEKKRFELELKKYAETQAVLLQEVNHRVKNNLSIIISLLRFEADRIENECSGGRQIIEEIETRITGLSIAHSMLASRGWRPLPLHVLCEKIIQTTVKRAGANNADIRIHGASVLVDSDQTHSLALVVNELALNAVRHGMIENVGLRIELTIESDAEQITMIFRDNGRGYPESLLQKQEHATVGFQIIEGIIRSNLNGKLELQNHNGAVARIIIPSLIREEEGGK